MINPEDFEENDNKELIHERIKKKSLPSLVP